MQTLAPTLRIVGLSLLVGGCIHHGPRDPMEARPRPIRVDVRNLNFNDAGIWAVYRAERVRLGMVTGKTEASFNLPWKGTEPVHMEIDLVGGARCATDELTVDEGDILYLEIAVELSSMSECRSG